MNRSFLKTLEYIFPSFLMGFVLYKACEEFYNVARGTGVFVNDFSRTWFVLFLLYVIFCVLLLFISLLLIWNNKNSLFWIQDRLFIREKIGFLRLPVALCFLLAPVVIFQYTVWGVVFQGYYTRILAWSVSVIVFAMIVTKGRQFVGWNEFLVGVILSAGFFTVLAPLKNVTNYPFSLGWSEGNRMWDYSIIFGRSRYDYPADQGIYVLLDRGRQMVGGVAFLIPGLTIGMERLWIGLTQIAPYFFLGFAAFRGSAKNTLNLLLLAIWAFLFLQQGPIHIPLVLSAVMTALAWRTRSWIAIPLIIFSGYYAQASRFSWLFAPGLWIGMLEFSSASHHNGRLVRAAWIRAIALSLAGAFGGYGLPKLLTLMSIRNLEVSDFSSAISNSGITAEIVTREVTHQSLLWYRLLPNATYETGIILGLLIAIGPLCGILFHLIYSKRWQSNLWQKAGIVIPLMAFLVVGLIASTKIGGGGDLHNMDMFLIGIFFTGVIAWRNGGEEWIYQAETIKPLVKMMIVLLIILPSIGPLMQLRSSSFGGEVVWLKTLTDAPDEDALGMLPEEGHVNSVLEEIQSEVDQAKKKGDVLFIDQRQLLTFGYITNVPFVPEYEKKILMNEALSADTSYFDQFYKDISSQRFSLIISEPLRTPNRDSSTEFGEENNAWVKWVSGPVLCYYEPLTTFRDFRVQLLVPVQNPTECVAVQLTK